MLLRNRISWLACCFLLSFLLWGRGSASPLDWGPRTEDVDLGGYQQVRYVDSTGGVDIPSAGTQAQPWATPAYAMSQVTDSGDTNRYAVLVAEGYYTGPITVGNAVHLFGGFENGTWGRDILCHRTYLSGGETQVVSMPGRNSKIDGFVITHMAEPKGRGVTLGGGGHEVSNNYICKNNQSGGYFGNSEGGGVYANTDNDPSGAVLLRRNAIFGNAQGGVWVETGVVEGNLIFRNTNMGAGSIGGSVEGNQFRKNLLLLNTPGYARHDLPGVAGLRLGGTCAAIGNWILFNQHTYNYNVGGISANANSRIVHNTLVGNAGYWFNDAPYPNGLYLRGAGIVLANNILWNEASSPRSAEIVGWSALATCTNNVIQGGAEDSRFTSTTLTDYPGFRANVSDISDAISYSTYTLFTSLNAQNLLMESNAWVGFPIRVGSTYSVIAENSTDTLSVWDDMTLGGTVTLPIQWEILDYRVASDSSCIDAGLSTGSIELDMESELRPADNHNVDGDWDPTTGGIPDIGADEFWDYEPPVFPGLQSLELGDGAVVLRWDPAQDPSYPCRYHIYMASASGAQDFSTPSYTTTGTSFTVANILTDRWYYFVVRAHDAFLNEDTNTVELSAKPRSALFNLALEGTMDGRRLTGLYGGGSDHACPALLDIDDDDDLDVFIGKGDGSLTFWPNLGGGRSGEWTTPEESYGGLAVGAGYAVPCFGDLDGDSDADLLIGDGNGRLAFYQNTGSVSVPAWALPISDYAGVDVGGYAAPAVGDLDGDGDVDLVVGGSDGTLVFVENLGSGWSPPLTDYANVAVAGNAAPALSDVDGDGDLDLVVGDVNGVLTYHENTGSPVAAAWNAARVTNWLEVAVGHDAAPALGRESEDGALLLFVGNREGDVRQFVVSEDEVSLGAGSFAMIDIGDHSVPAFGDLDGDGDFDMLLGGADGQLRVLWNTGTALNAQWSLPESDFGGMDVGSYASPVLYDLDGDGDVDVLLGALDGSVRYYRNRGSASSMDLVLESGNLAGIDAGYYSAPFVSDIDEDGDGDLFIGCGDGTVIFCENEGNASTPFWGMAQTAYLGLDVGDRARVVTADLDADGLPEILVGGADGQLLCVFNEGVAGAPDWSRIESRVAPYAGVDVGANATPVLCDVDNDGDPDLFVGEADGGVNFWRNMGARLRVTPRSATVLRDTELTLRVEGMVSTHTVTWSILENESGCFLTPIDAQSVRYTAGAVGGPNILDVVEATDTATGEQGRVHVNVIRSEDTGTAGRAVVCAGWKGATDSVWPATDRLTRMAYKVLRGKGYRRQDIYFLSPVTGVDVDGDGDATNDIDAESTLANLEFALTTWAEGSADLVVYLADHGWREGEAGYFRLNTGEENVLSASQLSQWLDALQAGTSMRQYAILDFCNSGSFVEALRAVPGKERFVVSACADDELTYFVASGLISFSESFWNIIFSGGTLGQAYAQARDAMDRYQSAWMDENGDGVYEADVDGAVASPAWTRHLGLSWIAGSDRPQIGKTVANQVLGEGETTVTLWVSEISGAAAIEEVWALIVPPDFRPDDGSTSVPVTSVPEVSFAYDEVDATWRAQYGGFDVDGSYKVIIYARDIWDSMSFPKQVYVHKSGLSEKAIVCIGATPYHSGGEIRRSWHVGNHAFQALRNRGFNEQRIQYLSSESGNWRVDALPTKMGLEDAIRNWPGSLSQLTILMVGEGATDTFRLNGTETVSATELDAWLDDYQTSTSARVVLLIDCMESGSFLNDLLPPAGLERVVLVSGNPGDSSWCLGRGMVSFSHFFLSRVFDGRSVGQSLNSAREAVRFWTLFAQNPALDDTGDGLATIADGDLADDVYIGAVFLTGGDDLPQIGSWTGSQRFGTGGVLSLWAQDVFDSDGVSTVTCTVVPQPPLDPEAGDVLTLHFDNATRRWNASRTFTQEGEYALCFVATDTDGNDSPVHQSQVEVGSFPSDPDAYEDDDIPANASTYTLSDLLDFDTRQVHNFHDSGDTDWTKFYARASTPYTVEILDVAPSCDPIVELYSALDLATPLVPAVNDGGTGEGETLSYPFTTEGFYYVRIRHADTSASGEGTSYTLQLRDNSGANNGLATALGANTIRCSWTGEVGPGQEGFTLYRSGDTRTARRGSSGFNWVAVNADPVPLNSVDDTGLTPGETYFYQVQVQHADGTEGQWTPIFYGATEAAGTSGPQARFTDLASTVSESDGKVWVRVELSEAQETQVVVWFDVSGTAGGSGMDYQIGTDHLVFLPGSTYEYIEVQLVEDNEIEPTETIVLTLSSASNAGLGAASVFTLSLQDGAGDAGAGGWMLYR